MPGGIAALGQETSVESGRFSPSRFMTEADRHGGLASYIRTLAGKAATGHEKVSFAPKGYRPSTPFRKGSSRQARSTGHAQLRSFLGGIANTAFQSVVWNASFTAACKIPVPGLPAMMGCGGTNDLAAIVTALDNIESSLVDIQAQLDDVQQQLSVIENQNAQAAYQTAFTFAGINPVNDAVNAAWSDLNYINAANPNPSSVGVPASKSDTGLCDAAYPSGYINGQNLQALCIDYLTRVQSFTAPQTPYYAQTYQSLTGVGPQPQNT